MVIPYKFDYFGSNRDKMGQRHTDVFITKEPEIQRFLALCKQKFAKQGNFQRLENWGARRAAFKPDSYERDWAQFLADNGADVIIGGHPHVLQPLEVLRAADGREVPVFYSLGNFLSHQTEMKNLLGGMASVTFTKDVSGIYVSEYELKPVVTVILRSEREYMFDYRPMLLEDYTEQIAAQHRFPECTVDAMQALYQQIVAPQEP